MTLPTDSFAALKRHAEESGGLLDAEDRLIAAASLFRTHGIQPRLDALVAEAAQLTHCPTAAISVMLRRTQRFMAAHGLPPELDVSRTTDRCSSFCMQVVRSDGVVQIDDAVLRTDLPLPLVDQYGVRAYLGVPIRAGGHLVGALCVMDVVPHAFTTAAPESLSRIAAQVEALLATASAEARRVRELTGHAARPAFAELRNVLCRISVATGLVETALADLAGGGELLAAAARGELTKDQLSRNAAVLGSANLATADARGLVREISDAFEQASRVIDALEKLAAPPEADVCWAHQILSAALTTAMHDTRLLGGVKVEPFAANLAVHVDLAEGATALGSVLSAVAHAAPHPPAAPQPPAAPSRPGIELRITGHEGVVDFVVSVSTIAEPEFAVLERRLATLLDGAPLSRIACARNGVTLRFDSIQPTLD